MIFQTIVSANAETFDLYMNNMRSLAVEMFKMAELVIINRCTKATPRATYRRSIKAVNRRVQVVFDSMVPGEDMGKKRMNFHLISAEMKFISKMMTTVYGSLMRWNVRNFMTERLW